MTPVVMVAQTSLADYYRVDCQPPVMVRVSVRYPVPPLCLTCVKLDCAHAELVEDYRAAQAAA